MYTKFLEYNVIDTSSDRLLPSALYLPAAQTDNVVWASLNNFVFLTLVLQCLHGQQQLLTVYYVSLPPPLPLVFIQSKPFHANLYL